MLYAVTAICDGGMHMRAGVLLYIATVADALTADAALSLL